MRHMIIALLIAMAPLTTKAGALERQFGGGYEGVIWGASLAELVQLRPGGEICTDGGKRHNHHLPVAP